MKAVGRLGVCAGAAALVLLAAAQAPVPDALVAGWTNDAVLQYSQDDATPLGDFVAAGSGGLDGAHAMSIGPDGHLYVASVLTDEVLRYDGLTGAPIDAFVPASLGLLHAPTDVKFGPDGAVYVGSFNDGSVHRFDAGTGAHLGAFVAPGAVPGFNAEWMEFHPVTGNLLVSSGPTLSAVLEFDGGDGSLVGAFVAPGAGGLDSPHALAFGPQGDLYVADFANDDVLRYDGTSGAFVEEFVAAGDGGLLQPHGLAFGPDGRLYVTSWGTHEVLRYDGATGDFVDVYVGAQSGGLLNPQAILFRPPTASPWSDVRSGLAGTHGVPCLLGEGTLEPGSPGSLALTDALENTTAALFVGVAELNAPFKGGTLVPAPTLLILGLGTGPAGAITLPFTWPGGLPSGFPIWFQFWVIDPAGPAGLSASNGLKATVP
jgi:outer membrane protein assembly factor BamB